MISFLIIVFVFTCIFASLGGGLYFGPDILKGYQNYRIEAREQATRKRVEAERVAKLPPPKNSELVQLEQTEQQRLALRARELAAKQTYEQQADELWEREFALETGQTPPLSLSDKNQMYELVRKGVLDVEEARSYLGLPPTATYDPVLRRDENQEIYQQYHHVQARLSESAAKINAEIVRTMQQPPILLNKKAQSYYDDWERTYGRAAR